MISTVCVVCNPLMSIQEACGSVMFGHHSAVIRHATFQPNMPLVMQLGMSQNHFCSTVLVTSEP